MSKHDKAGGSSLLTGRNIAAALIVAALLAFVLQNRNKVKLSWLMFSFETGLWLLLAVALVLAFLAGLLIGRSSKSSK